MRTHSPRARLDHDTSFPAPGTFAAWLVLGLLTAVMPQLSAAQGAVPCTAIENDAERLACYDRALRGTPPPPAATRAARPTPTPAAPAAAPAAQAAPAAAAPAQSSQERAREQPARETAAAPAARTTAPAAPATVDDDEDKTTPLVIVGVRSLPGRETTFTAEDGTIWVQTDSQRIFGLPDPPFDADLRAGAMGSHFLVPNGRGRAIRVRAVR